MKSFLNAIIYGTVCTAIGVMFFHGSHVFFWGLFVSYLVNILSEFSSSVLAISLGFEND